MSGIVWMPIGRVKDYYNSLSGSRGVEEPEPAEPEPAEDAEPEGQPEGYGEESPKVTRRRLLGHEDGVKGVLRDARSRHGIVGEHPLSTFVRRLRESGLI